MNMEKPEYKFRYAAKPQIDSRISGTVYVVDQFGRGYCYVRWAEPFANALGWFMPRGISKDYPCYLRVVQMPHLWRVFGLYIDGGAGAILAEYMMVPAWIKKVWRHETNSHAKKSRGKSGGSYTIPGIPHPDNRPIGHDYWGGGDGIPSRVPEAS